MDILINVVFLMILLVMIESKDIKNRLRDIEEFLLAEYKELRVEKSRDWRTYEQGLMHRIKSAVRSLDPLIDEAVKTIKIHREKGRLPVLSLKQKVILLLLKQLFGKSNRVMAGMLAVFSLLSSVDVSYKTVERLYSDPLIEIALYNLHVLILRKKGLKDVDASGDGTGYSLTIKKHYASEANKRKNKIKTSDKRSKAFVYSFNIIDLDSKMYVSYGMSLKSEKDAYNKAVRMLRETGIMINSLRLDKYFSYPSTVDAFTGKVYLIPKKNATLNGSWKWKRLMFEFVTNTLNYLEEYYKRNNSETGFSIDKRLLGWKIMQRKPNRINTALNCTTIWHNILQLHTTN